MAHPNKPKITVRRHSIEKPISCWFCAIFLLLTPLCIAADEPANHDQHSHHDESPTDESPTDESPAAEFIEADLASEAILPGSILNSSAYRAPAILPWRRPRFRVWAASSPLLHPRKWMKIKDPNDRRRHRGKGSPLRGTSWRNRPYHVGWFMGGIVGDALVGGSVEQDAGLFGGYRFGKDFSHYFGYEGRFAFANLGLTGPGALTGPNTARNWYWDVELLYYPWGDSKWRPYATVGLGVANFRFTDAAQRRFDDTLIQLPVGFGVKYLFRKWLSLRFDVLDNIALRGSGLDTMHNWSVTTGVEVRFGGRRHSYFPWNPGKTHF